LPAFWPASGASGAFAPASISILNLGDVLGTTSSEHNSQFEELFLPYLDAAYNLTYWIVGGEQDAEDIVQDAYVRALKGFPRFRGNNPRAWLLTIVRNTAYSWTKKRNRVEERLVPFEEDIHAARLEIEPSEPYRERETQLIDQALKRLPVEFRETLVLFELEGWSYKTIAAKLNIPLGTVMSRLSRARRLLQQELTRCVSVMAD
jgi:RNA polymerase sigma-70 factor, ECF subfamily